MIEQPANLTPGKFYVIGSENPDFDYACVYAIDEKTFAKPVFGGEPRKEPYPYPGIHWILDGPFNTLELVGEALRNMFPFPQTQPPGDNQ